MLRTVLPLLEESHVVGGCVFVSFRVQALCTRIVVSTDPRFIVGAIAIRIRAVGYCYIHKLTPGWMLIGRYMYFGRRVVGLLVG